MCIKGINTLTDWAIIKDPRDPYKAPEMRQECLTGKRESDLVNGTSCTTTPIVGKTSDGYVVTRSGTHYKLLTVHPDYEKQFPNAFERLINSLQVIS